MTKQHEDEFNTLIELLKEQQDLSIEQFRHGRAFLKNDKEEETLMENLRGFLIAYTSLRKQLHIPNIL